MKIEQETQQCSRRFHRLDWFHFSKRKHPRRSFDRQEERRRMRRATDRREKKNETNCEKNAEAEKEEEGEDEEKSYSNKSVCFFLFLFISTSLFVFNYVKVFEQTKHFASVILSSPGSTILLLLLQMQMPVIGRGERLHSSENILVFLSRCDQFLFRTCCRKTKKMSCVQMIDVYFWTCVRSGKQRSSFFDITPFLIFLLSLPITVLHSALSHGRRQKLESLRKKDDEMMVAERKRIVRVCKRYCNNCYSLEKKFEWNFDREKNREKKKKKRTNDKGTTEACNSECENID